MHGRLVEQFRTMLNGPALRIARTIIEPRYAGMGDCACAHGAWFEGYPQVATGQPVGSQRVRCGAQRNDFGMGGRIMRYNGLIGTCGDNHAIFDNQCPDGHFAGSGSLLRKVQRLLHDIACMVQRHARQLAAFGGFGHIAGLTFRPFMVRGQRFPGVL